MRIGQAGAWTVTGLVGCESEDCVRSNTQLPRVEMAPVAGPVCREPSPDKTYSQANWFAPKRRLPASP